MKKYTALIDNIFKAIGESPMQTSLTCCKLSRTEVSKWIDETLPADLIKPWEVNSGIHVDLLKAALFLWNDDFEEAHNHSQIAQNIEGSYWHAILHRREPDASNAGYWYARVGSHPVFHQMAKIYPGWKPEKFIIECGRATLGPTMDAALEKQVKEFELLFDYTFGLAVKKKKKK